MSKRVNIKRFDALEKRAEKYNQESRELKRFYPIRSRDGKMLVFGMYDYKSKKYVLSTFTSDLNAIFDEIEDMLNDDRK